MIIERRILYEGDKARIDEVLSKSVILGKPLNYSGHKGTLIVTVIEEKVVVDEHGRSTSEQSSNSEQSSPR